jgi:hypothetical protein
MLRDTKTTEPAHTSLAPSSMLTVLGSRTIGIVCESTFNKQTTPVDAYGGLPYPFLLDVPKNASQQSYLTTFRNSKTANLLTMTSFPVNLRVRLGGMVSARSVKYLARLQASKADQETRDQW